MPSGTSLTARYGCFHPNDCRFDLTLYPLIEDMDRSEGLCGNYNGIKHDDRTPKGSTTVDTDSEPIRFTNSYM